MILQVAKRIANIRLTGMEQDSKAVEIPTQEEMEKQKDLIKQLAEAGQEVAAGIEDLLKEMFNGE